MVVAQHGNWIEEVLRAESQQVPQIWASTFATDFIGFLRSYDVAPLEEGGLELSRVQRDLWTQDSVSRGIFALDFSRFDSYIDALRRERSAREGAPIPPATPFNSACLFLQLFYNRLQHIIHVHCLTFIKDFVQKMHDQPSPRLDLLNRIATGRIPFVVVPKNAQITRSVRDLRAEDAGHLINLVGVVTRVTDVRPELVEGVFECAVCRTEVRGVKQSYKFTHPAQCANAGCSNRVNWGFVKEKSRFINWQKMKLQETTDAEIVAKLAEAGTTDGSEPLTSGSIPRNIDVVTRGVMCDACKPGDVVNMTGFVVTIPDVASLVNAKEVPREIRTEKMRTLNSEQGLTDDGVTGLSKLGVRDISYKLTFIALDINSYVEDDSVNNELSSTMAAMNQTLVELFSMAKPTRQGRNASHFQELLNSPICKFYGVNEECHKRFRKIANSFNTADRLVKQVAPFLWGYDDVKKGLLVLLVGGVEKVSGKDRTRLRGDLNVLLVGDPGCGKSQFLKFVQAVAERGIYASGQCSTAAGLTASVHRDAETGDSVIEPGALILADKGVCCIDEFDMMDQKDMIAIHEAMEQQTISVSKAGIQATMNARASVLTACTPIDGKYKNDLPLQSNVRLTPTILSRFDLAFVLTESSLNNSYQQMAAHRFSGEAGGAEADGEDLRSFDELRLYLKIARAFKPRLTMEAKDVIVQRYIRQRQNSKNIREKNRADSRATTRMLESMLRVAEAFAKLSFSKVVTKAHAQQAIKLMDSQKRQRVETIEVVDSEDESMAESSTPSTISADEFDLIQTLLVAHLSEHDSLCEINASTAGGATADPGASDGVLGLTKKELVDWFIEEKANGTESMRKPLRGILSRMKAHGVLYESDGRLLVHPNFAGISSTTRSSNKQTHTQPTPQPEPNSATVNSLISSTFMEELYNTS